MRPKGEGPAGAHGHRGDAVQHKAGEDRRGAAYDGGVGDGAVGAQLQRAALILGGIGQLHNDGQLATRGPDPCPDIGMPIEMIGPGGGVPRDLRAFAEIGQIKAEGVAVGGGDMGDHLIQHPGGGGDIIQPGQFGRPDLG